MIYRQEHPKPQFERSSWLNLNGKWQFEFDHCNSGRERKLFEVDKRYTKEINVPFAPESQLSGIGFTDFMTSVWYKRDFELTSSQLSGRVVLHFGAVDYIAVVYVNGVKAGEHKGGYTSFSFDVTNLVKEGVNQVCVNALDNPQAYDIPTGKQDKRFNPAGVLYTRCTGIWQTVWMEFTPKTYIKGIKFYPNIKDGSVNAVCDLVGAEKLVATVTYKGKRVGYAKVESNGGRVGFTIKVTEVHLWEAGKGELYDVQLCYGQDQVKSYFGLREVRIDGYKILINEKVVFQRLVLDQGYYPDGIYTAPSDKALERDVLLSLEAGFNGARLHQKVFEERFLYHCDRLGYLVWGEFPSWIMQGGLAQTLQTVMPEWVETVERDFNHPSIIGWGPFNEMRVFRDEWNSVWHQPWRDFCRIFYDITKTLDPTRPVNLVSGGAHDIDEDGKLTYTDIVDGHNNAPDGKSFAEQFKNMPESYYSSFLSREEKIHGMPMYISEYGTIWWWEDDPEEKLKHVGAPCVPQTKEEALELFRDVTKVLMDNPYMFGLCYVQLYDVEGEVNGIYTYDRRPKFDIEKIRKVLTSKAAIED